VRVEGGRGSHAGLPRGASGAGGAHRWAPGEGPRHEEAAPAGEGAGAPREPRGAPASASATDAGLAAWRGARGRGPQGPVGPCETPHKGRGRGGARGAGGQRRSARLPHVKSLQVLYHVGMPLVDPLEDDSPFKKSCLIVSSVICAFLTAGTPHNSCRTSVSAGCGRGPHRPNMKQRMTQGASWMFS